MPLPPVLSDAIEEEEGPVMLVLPELLRAALPPASADAVIREALDADAFTAKAFPLLSGFWLPLLLLQALSTTSSAPLPETRPNMPPSTSAKLDEAP